MLSKCCCCVPLRTGSIILAILGLLGGIGTFATSKGFWGSYILGVVYLVAYGALLFGAIKNNDKAVLINLVFTGIIMVLTVILGIIVIASIGIFAPGLENNCAAIASWLRQNQITCDQFKGTTIGRAAGIFFVSALINGYFWLCNYSFYKELKGGNANPA